MAKTRREAVAQRARADAAEAALARAVSQRNAEKNEGDSAADSAPSQALRAALRLTLRAMAELEAARQPHALQALVELLALREQGHDAADFEGNYYRRQ